MHFWWNKLVCEDKFRLSDNGINYVIILVYRIIDIEDRELYLDGIMWGVLGLFIGRHCFKEPATFGRCSRWW